MQSYLLIIVSTALVNNVILVELFGLCPFKGVSGKLEIALSMGVVSAFVLTFASGANYLVNQYLLVPYQIEYLRLVAFVIVIAATLRLTDAYVHRTNPLLAQTLGIYVPLASANCAVLGVPLLIAQDKHDFLEALLYGFGAALGFTLVLIVFASLRERLEGAQVPGIFRGTAIAMITAGLMSLGFMGFAGLVK